VTVAPSAPVGSTPSTRASVTPAASLNFLALPDDGTVIPPDTDGAVGPNHVVTILNSQVGIQDRFGNSISVVSFNGFWAAVAASTDILTDPRVLYDPFQNRWITTASDVSQPALILIGVSATSDPTGVWNLFSVTADASGQSFADFPETGFNKDWIVVQANMFTVSGSTYSGSNIYVFSKAALYAGTGAPFTLLMGPDGGEAAATMYDNSLATIYLIADAGPGFADVFSITGAIGSETLSAATSVAAPSSWQLPPADSGVLPQLGGPNNIDAGDTRMLSVKYRNGSLWATQNVFLPAAGTFNRVAGQWWQIDPVTPTVIQFGRVDDPTGKFFYAYPSIAVNKSSDVLIGYSRFSSTQYASACYSYRASTDAPSTLRPEVLLKAGEGIYYKTFGGGSNRWGDFSATAVDPLNDLNFWTIQEYAATPSPPGTMDGDGNWGTWWGFIKSPDSPSDDFDGNGTSDLLWQHTSGAAGMWLMNGTTAQALTSFAPQGWTVLSGEADFNGDGKSDLLWTNPNGAIAIWLMNGTTVLGSAAYGPMSGWTLKNANADFNGDGKTDLVWTNTNGAVAIWLMNGTSVIDSVGFGPFPGWTLVSANNDFNGDGKSDLLWTNTNGAAAIWLMDGTNVIGSAAFGPAPGWTILSGDADYNGDGMTDLLWTNTNGAVAIWLMNGTSVISSTSYAVPGWTVVSGKRDFNGDGKSDLLWTNANGAVAIWLMNGTSVVGSAGYAVPGWTVVSGKLDFNGDGMTDLLFTNTNGAAAIWLMNGTAVLGSAAYGPIPGWTVTSGRTGP
jgi:FG-GAP repeat protein